MPRKSKTVQATPELRTNNYTLKVLCAGKEYEANGNSLLECMQGITKIVPIKGFSYLQATVGKHSKTIRLNQLQTRRFLINKVYKQLLNKRFSL